jgi:hypothetical protein
MANALNSRTIQFALALAILSGLQGYVAQIPASPEVQGVIGLVVAVAIAVLRVITTVPLSEK